MGAALACYTLFSRAPLLLIAISVAGAVFGIDAARAEILGQLHSLLGRDGADAVAGLLLGVQRSGQSAMATVIGAVSLTVSLAFSAGLAAWGRGWAPAFGEGALLLSWANHGLSFVLTALLVWVYASAQVFLCGAEVTWMFARQHGSRRGMDKPAP